MRDKSASHSHVEETLNRFVSPLILLILGVGSVHDLHRSMFETVTDKDRYHIAACGTGASMQQFERQTARVIDALRGKVRQLASLLVFDADVWDRP
jgi:hypothetical protein